MKWKNSILFLLFSLCLFTACGSKEKVKYEDSRFAFGTYIKIVTYTENEKKAKKAIDKAFLEIERIDSRFNSKQEGSLISQLNHSETHQVEMDEEGISLLQEIQKAHKLSKGKYDITIAPLLKLWGFEEESEPHIPTSEELEQIRTLIDFEKVKIEGNKIELEKPIHEMDTGSFLKGYALARAKKVLQEEGLENAFLSAISSIELMGEKPDGNVWRIALENPDNSEEMLGIVTLTDRAIGVSGDYQTYLEIDGKKYHHILDKETGYPVEDKKMVVVLAKDGLQADIYSTTFFLMPISDILDYVNSQEEMDVLVVDKDMNFHMSRNFERYFSKK